MSVVCVQMWLDGHLDSCAVSCCFFSMPHTTGIVLSVLCVKLKVLLLGFCYLFGIPQIKCIYCLTVITEIGVLGSHTCLYDSKQESDGRLLLFNQSNV